MADKKQTWVIKIERKENITRVVEAETEEDAIEMARMSARIINDQASLKVISSKLQNPPEYEYPM